MEVVADHLCQEVYRRADQAEKDLFGRSAFNRYYYATFLHVRTGLRQLNDPDWFDLPHKVIPDVLKGAIRKKLSKGRVDASKVNDTDVVKLCERAKHAALELSELMKKGYATRVVADYYPEIEVSFAGDREFFLHSVGTNDARDWPQKASVYVRTIVLAWGQIND